MFVPNFEGIISDALRDQRKLSAELNSYLAIPEDERDPKDTPTVRLLFKLHRNAKAREMGAREMLNHIELVLGDVESDAKPVARPVPTAATPRPVAATRRRVTATSGELFADHDWVAVKLC